MEEQPRAEHPYEEIEARRFAAAAKATRKASRPPRAAFLFPSIAGLIILFAALLHSC